MARRTGKGKLWTGKRIILAEFQRFKAKEGNFWGNQSRDGGIFGSVFKDGGI
ncbi:uncharacterized protein J3R85_001697 [Psidium guajava]|nr:uncharacterized protein J3R85_001697 [Psidium guajava]